MENIKKKSCETMGHEGNDKEIGRGGITLYVLNLTTG
jgi:hypothetical protein